MYIPELWSVSWTCSIIPEPTARSTVPGISHIISNVYNMSGRVVLDIQTRAEGESLYIRYNTDANVVNNLKNDSSYKFIGEVILKINVV